MPLALDPNETFEVVLDSDSGRPDPPTFLFRYQTAREWREYVRLGDEEENLRSLGSDEVLRRLYEALAGVLVGWKNVLDREGRPVSFRAEDLDAVTTVGEAWELYYAARRQSRLDADGKKNSASPSPTSSGASAGGPAPTAATGPTNGSPPSSSAPDATEPDVPNAPAAGESN